MAYSTIVRKVKTENRRQIRYPGNGAVIRASWIDIAGSLRMGQARLVDICEGGLAMELPEKPQANTYIRFQCDKMKLYGTGAVRHCASQGSRFIVGVEFSGGVRWSPPQTIAVETMVTAQFQKVPSSDEFKWNWLFDGPAESRMGGCSSGND